jgi:Ca2+-binding RTX toxin-like protein
MRLLVVIPIIALFPALPAPAEAGRAERTTWIAGDKGGTWEESDLAYAATPGTGTRIEVRLASGGVEISDTGGAEAGTGCRQVDRERVLCATSNRIAVDAGDGDDVVLADGSASVTGGAGDDRLESSGAIAGGPGDDVLQAGPGGARLEGGGGADALLGGPGTDTAAYGGHTAGVHADLEGDADDGAPGEGDRISAAVEGLSGGAGADVLVGDARANTLEADDPRAATGRPGDRLSGGGGDDSLTAGGGDVAHGGAGDDGLRTTKMSEAGGPVVLAGGPGHDRLSGNVYAERMIGGPGRDLLDAVGGRDELRAVDGERDWVSCAYGTGRARGVAHVDSSDWTQTCTRRGVTRRGSARLVVVEAVFHGSRVASVSVGCPHDHRGRCRARVRLVHRGRTLLDRRVTLVATESRSWGPRRLPFGAHASRAHVRLDVRNAAGRRLTVRGPVDQRR